MKALSVQQPWAWALLAGIKPVENRTWSTSFRGTVAIHAAKGTKWDADGRAHIASLRFEVPKELPRGVLLGTVEIVDCLPACEARRRFGDAWVGDGWCFVIENPRPFPQPVPCKGRLGFFDVSDELRAAGQE